MMEIRRIEAKFGFTVNAGDYQNVKAEVGAGADIMPNEDALKAHGELAEFIQKALIEGAKRAHPDAIRSMLNGEARLIEAGQTTKPAATKGKGKGRTTKEPEPIDVGGLDKEDELEILLDEGDEWSEFNALDDAGKLMAIKEKLTELMKKSKTEVQRIFRLAGCENLKGLVNSNYLIVYQEAIAALAKIK